jgi:hypothetical protein
MRGTTKSRIKKIKEKQNDRVPYPSSSIGSEYGPSTAFQKNTPIFICKYRRIVIILSSTNAPASASPNKALPNEKVLNTRSKSELDQYFQRQEGSIGICVSA